MASSRVERAHVVYALVCDSSVVILPVWKNRSEPSPNFFVS